MKKTLYHLIIAASLAVMIPTAPAAVLLTDNFNVVSGNSQNVNEDIVARQTGPLASVASGFFSTYTYMQEHHQVGNSTTDVGQPGGTSNSGFVLLAFSGSFQSDLDIPKVSTGPLTLEVDMYNNGSNPGGGSDAQWVAFTLRYATQTAPNSGGSDEFGFLKRANGGVQIFNGAGDVAGGALDVPGTATADHWTLTFDNGSGGSAFNGTGSQVTISNGAALLGTFPLSQLSSSGLKLGFTCDGNRFAGIDNLTVSGTAPTPASPPVLFRDTFSAQAGNAGASGDANNNLNFDLANRESGPLAPTTYTGIHVHHQVGNGGTDVGQPGGGNNSGYVLMAFDGQFQSDMNIAAVSTGPLIVEVDMFNNGSNPGGSDNQGRWVAFSLRAAGQTFPVAGSGEFGFLKRANGGVQVFQNGGEITGGAFDLPGAASADHWTVTFTDTAGTGSAFNGNGSKVTLQNGSTVLTTLTLSQLNSSGLKLGFWNDGNQFAGIDNLTIRGTAPAVIPPTLVTDVQPRRSEVATGTPMALSVTASGTALSYQWYHQGSPIGGATTNSYSFNAVTGTNDFQVIITNTIGSVTSAVAVVISATNVVTVNNFSFENGSTPAFGNGSIPAAWTSYNNNWAGVVGDTAAYSPAIIPDGGNYFAVNSGPADPINGVYQDVGALLPNTTYMLTVAIGRRNDQGPGPNPGDWSSGIISLRNGTDNTGTVLASTTGYPATAGTWQDYTATFITGPSVSGHLTVSLGVPPANTYQAAFDHVRLTKAPAPAIIPPTLLTDISQRRSAVTTGTPMTFSVTVNGDPLNYQWYNQGGPIGGATTNSYSFNAATGTNSYFVVVTNTSGSVTSSTAVVISAPNLVTVNNFSFENGSTPAFGNGAIPLAWTSFNGDWAGLGTSGGGFDAPDGNTYFAVNTGPSHSGASGIYQDVGALQPNTTYTLTVAVGRSTAAGVPPNGVGDWSPGNIALLNGTDSTGTLLATTTGYPGTVGTWEDFTATFSTGPATSGDLVVTLSDDPANTWQATFDNVRLTKAAVAPPTPPTLGAPSVSGGNLIVTGTGGTPNAAYTWLSTTNLAAPVIWVTNSTGTLDGTGAFSNSIPIGADPASFFRLRLP